MLILTIDGVEVEVGENVNLVEAAKAAGIDIPTYCYHPGLQSVGRCRMCLVEVEGVGGLVPACSTRADQAMEVRTRTDQVRRAREAVLEFLLLHHPLDCPVCDRAGECALQDHAMAFAPNQCAATDKRRTFPGFDGRDIGPRVEQHQSRCIRCTRCTRVSEEIFETDDLVIKGRGSRILVDTFDGRPFDNSWSVCAADVCPVGALTEKSFRLRAPVWELKRTPAVCPGCSIGCTIWVDHVDDVIQRVKPRFNPEVNGWWMCDHGRSVAIEGEHRDLEGPLARKGGDTSIVPWSEGMETLSEMIGRTRPKIVASANISNEALYLIRRVLVDHAGLEAVVPVEPFTDRWVKNARRQKISCTESQPNLHGAVRLGLPQISEQELRAFVADGPLLILDNQAHHWLETEEAAELVGERVAAVFGQCHTPLSRSAKLIFPVASWFETEGSSTSSTGRVQLSQRFRSPRGSGRPLWRIVMDLGIRLNPAMEEWRSPKAVFDAMAGEVSAFAGMTYGRLWSEQGISVLEGSIRGE